jgi:hypothetical protein
MDSKPSNAAAGSKFGDALSMKSMNEVIPDFISRRQEHLEIFLA